MRKKLETRFPAGRIKKIMQADEDVGKIALAVPVLVSKALEMFLQDLCDKTYDITVRKGLKTVSSFHLKQCIQSNVMFDFLKDVVKKVPDLRGFGAGGEDKSSKRRKAVDESKDKEEDLKQYKIEKTRAASRGGSSSIRGRGRPRGRPKGSGRKGDRNNSSFDRYMDGTKSAEEASDSEEQLKEIAFGQGFDLNLDYVENLKVLGTDMMADYDDNKQPLLNVSRSFEEEEEDDYDNEED